MPRAMRYIVSGHTYHVTHRCHNRDFLLRCRRDRTAYRGMLRDHLAGSGVRLFSYCITSNHVHLLLRPEPAAALERLSHLMQGLEGEFARSYNPDLPWQNPARHCLAARRCLILFFRHIVRIQIGVAAPFYRSGGDRRRKGRTNAFWGDRYHATMIESGAHLWRCLVYIDMNMVRAGAVKHPREWAWTGYQELMGLRKRYRVVDVRALLEHVDAGTEQSFREH